MIAIVLFSLFILISCLTNFVFKRSSIGLLAGWASGTAFALLALWILYLIEGDKFFPLTLVFGGSYASVASAILSSASYGVRKMMESRRLKPGHCEKCGYCLFGNQSGVCPECGQPVDQVRLAAAKLGVKLDGE